MIRRISLEMWLNLSRNIGRMSIILVTLSVLAAGPSFANVCSVLREKPVKEKPPFNVVPLSQILDSLVSLIQYGLDHGYLDNKVVENIIGGDVAHALSLF